MKEPSYLDWALKVSGLNPNFNSAVFPTTDIHMNGLGPKIKNDYNYKLGYLQDPNGKINLSEDGRYHLSDAGKLPNHPTFSNESAYGIGNNTAGRWVEPMSESDQWRYHNPSRGMLYAPEDVAYQEPTTGMAALSRIWQALNQR